MLSRWRKQAREGLIVTKDVKIDTETAAELNDPKEQFWHSQGTEHI